MKLKLLVAGILLMGIAHAQKLTFDKVETLVLRNSGSILQQGQIKGYFFFYQTDKIDRHTNAYSLQILDENLNKVKEISMEDSKDIELLEAAYNGDALSFLFCNRKDKNYETRIYGLDGKMKFTYSRAMDRDNEAFLKLYANPAADGYANQEVFSVDNKGFITILPIENSKKNSYEVEYNSSIANKQWVYTPEESEEKYIRASYLASTDSLIILEVTKKKGRYSGSPTVFVVGLNFETKKKAFEIEEGRDNYLFVPEYCTKLVADGRLMLIGPYFNKTDNISKDFSLGIGIYTVGNDGKIISKTYNNWSQDIGKYLPTNEKGKIDDVGYLFFHNIIQASDGNLFVVGEGYKRVADALGIANGILSAKPIGGYSKLKITDMVIMEFGQDFKIKGATIQEKHHSFFHSDAVDMVSQHLLALVIKAYGGFDYAFTTSDKDVNSFSVCYRNYERTSDYKGQTFEILRYNGTKFVNDKIQLSSKATHMKVLPAKPGFVLIMEYYKKEKKIDLRMEKIG